MLYYILRPFVNILLKFLTKRITITGLENIPKTGAVILASNHSNSFLDAAIIGCNIDRRMWSLGRGDIFKKPLARKILSSFFMLPVHRLSEGKEYLSGNDETFSNCIELFKKGEVVLIFPEGICTNQTKLLPLKKGASRLAQQAWNEGIDLKIVPIGIAYHSFTTFGKIIHFNVGKTIEKADFESISEDGFFIKDFNELLTKKMTALQNWSFTNIDSGQNLIFSITSILFFPANFLAEKISRKMTKGSVFFDSVMLGLLVVIMPIYWFLLAYLICSVI